MCAALTCGVSFADEDPTLSFYEGFGHYKLEGSFFIDADAKAIWEVLTDYENIPRFVGSMKVSHVETRFGDNLVLHQEPEGGFLFFTKRLHLTLKVHETPGKSIVFQDTSHQDFTFYQGSWQIKPAEDGKGFEVIYDLDAQQNFDAPAFLAGDAVSGGARDLLKKIREEIIKRKEIAEKRVLENAKLTQLPRATPTADTDNREDN
jgi:ribosome-associated toxin RatA of RatAB toxin-antitoxin module